MMWWKCSVYNHKKKKSNKSFLTLASCSLKVFVLSIWATVSNAAVRGSMNCSNWSSSSPAHTQTHTGRSVKTRFLPLTTITAQDTSRCRLLFEWASQNQQKKRTKKKRFSCFYMSFGCFTAAVNGTNSSRKQSDDPVETRVYLPRSTISRRPSAV